MLRRCLQVDENEQQFATDGFAACNSSDSQTKFQESSHVLSTTALIDGQPIKPTSSANSLCLSSVTGNSQFAVPKPPGIGLYLNSIVTVRSVSHEIENAQSPEGILKGKDLVFIMKNHLTSDVNSSSASSKVGKVFSSSKIEMLESKASKAGIPRKLVCQNTLKSSSIAMLPQPSNNLKSSSIAILPQLSDNHAPSYGKRKYSSEHSKSVEVVNRASPKRKRTKASTNDGEDCRHCNCKKSKCLKLYCDCFAAGFYRAESCACKECFNRPDYEDTVLEVRQQIESKNPKAFAPKVAQSVANSLANSVANVGCSDGCRCEDCRNVFGKKEGGLSLVHDEWVSFNYSTLCTALLDSSTSLSLCIAPLFNRF
ncbi:hypothetical protein Ancab_002452 [Ancistrocladus abbreviatus]